MARAARAAGSAGAAARPAPDPTPGWWGWPPAWMRPRRSIRPTRDGWWCVVAAVGLGVAGVNTGNNLAYLLCALLLAVITVSGILSDLAMRGLALTPVWPATLHAGQPALVGVVVRNRRRWLNAYSLALEVLPPGGPRAAPARTVYLARLPPGAEQLLTWDLTLPARGWRPIGGVRVTTRFPFGLFVKAGRPQLATRLLVYPALAGGVADRLPDREGAGAEAARRRRGRGLELAGLRDYQVGDEPRLVHWPTSARTGRLTVRDLEEDAARDTRLVLVPGPGGEARLERGLSEAAALAVHLLRAGAAVELMGPGVLVPLGRGANQERAVLTALALYAPPPAGATSGATSPGGPVGDPGLRELRVRLG